MWRRSPVRRPRGQNVETLYWIRDIVEKGAAWATSARPPRAQRLRSFSVSAREKTGVVLRLRASPRANSSTSTAAAWSMAETFKAYLPGGASAASCLRRWPTSRSTSAPWKNTAASRSTVVILSEKDDMRPWR